MKKIVLVACSAGKLATDIPVPAGELYQSQLFTAARKYAEKHAPDSWFILSAEYGLLSPKTLILPYDRTLNTMNKVERRHWAGGVMAQVQQTPAFRGVAEVTFLAGKNYREHLFLAMHLDGMQVRAPMAGMGIGKQLQYLAQELAK